MSTHIIRPTSSTGTGGMAYSGAASLHAAINEAAYSEASFIHAADVTSLADIYCGMADLPGTFAGIVINGVKVVWRLFWNPGIEPEAPATWQRDWNVFVRVGGTRYDSPTTHGRADAATWPHTEENTWLTNPATAGLRWTVSDIDALEIGYEETGKTGDQNGIPIAQAYAVVNFEPVAGEQDRVRDILTRRLVSVRRGRRLLEVDAPIAFADLELGSLVRVAHDLGPEASGLGWTPTAPRLFRVLRSSIDLRRFTVRLLLEDVRANVGIYRHFEIDHVSVTPGLGLQGIARAGLGGTRAITRATRAWVDDAGASAAGWRLVTEVPNNFEKLDAAGLLIEAAATNYLGRSSFLDGSAGAAATGWTVVTGTVITSETTAAHQLLDAGISYDPATQSVKHGKLIVTASTAQASRQDSTTTLLGWHTVSVDYVAVTADNAQLRIQRTSDSFYWTGSVWQAGTSSHSVGTTSGRFQVAVDCDDGVGGAITLRVTVRGSTTTDGDEWRWQHVQVEVGKYATSRIVTSGGVAGTRNADVVTITQPSGKAIILSDGMTLIQWVVPEWSSADISADRVFLDCVWDANNNFRLRYEDSAARWEAVLEAGGVTYTAYLAGAVTKGTAYRVAVRLCSSAGEHGLAAYTLSIFVDGVKGTDVVAALATEAVVSMYLGSNASSGEHADAFFRRFIVTPFVLNDAEIGRFQ